MSLTTEELQLKISANIADASSKLKEIDSLTKKTSKGAKDMGMSFAKMRDIMQGPVAAFRLVSGAISKLGSEVDKYMAIAAETEKAQAILNSTLTATGANAWTSAAKLNEYAKTMAKVTLFEDDAVTSMQGILLGFRNIQGINFDRASTEILNMAQVMGMDLTSAAQAVGKALDNPIAGLDSLSRQGFKFSAAEKAMIKELVETNRLADAQDIILKELSKTYGGAAAAAANTATGSYQNMKKAIKDVNEEIGIAIANSTNWKTFTGWIGTIADGLALVNQAKSIKDRAAELAEIVGTRGFSEKTTQSKIKAIRDIGLTADEAAEGLAAITASIEQYKKDMNSPQATLSGTTGEIADEIKALEKQKQTIEKVIPFLNKYKEAIPIVAPVSPPAVSEEEKEKRRLERLQLELELNGDLATAREASMGHVDYLDMAKAWGDPFAAQMVVLDEVYQEDADNFKKAQEEKLESAQATYDLISQMEQGLADEYASLEKNKSDIYVFRLEKQKAAMEKNGEDTTKIDEKIKGEKNRIAKKQFEAEKLNSLAKIVMSTAESVQKAYSELGPIAGSFAAGVVGAAGIAQGAMVMSQQYVPMAEGGRGTVTKPTLFLAGEAGPEDFAFGPKRKGGLSGGTTVVNNYYGSPWAIREAEAVAMGGLARAGRGY